MKLASIVLSTTGPVAAAGIGFFVAGLVVLAGEGSVSGRGCGVALG